jgi:hypothetical protein
MDLDSALWTRQTQHTATKRQPRQDGEIIALRAIRQACVDPDVEAWVSKADRSSKVHKFALRVILLEDALDAITERDLL